MHKAKYIPPTKVEHQTKADPPHIQDPKTRIIQKNLVYLIGLPQSLASDEILKQESFMGQYGKILKVMLKT